MDEGDYVDELAAKDGSGRGKRKGKKAVVGIGVILMVLVIAFVVVGALRGGNKQPAHVPVKNDNNNSSGQQTEEEMTRQAVADATNSNPSTGNVKSNELAQGKDATGASNLPVTDLPPVINTNLSGTVTSTQGSNSSDGSGPAQQVNQPGALSPSVAATATSTSGRNGERSVSIAEIASSNSAAAPARKPEPERGSRTERNVSPEGVALPPFGTMLRVRSLGALFTLRTGSLARFELAQDVKGRGWSISRGTVFIGALRGSEYDRAYVALVGFIDPESGKLIKINGDLLGGDGATGIRGKKRKIGGGWSRVLGKIGDAGLNIASSLAGSIGRRPIIINDAFGASGGRLTSELDGLLQNRNQREFVEVPAGTSGYIMITDLPESIQGVDALSAMSAGDLAEKSDVGQRRKTTGLSELELAELIQSGDAERLRAALPRMTPEMRRVAESVLASGGGDE
jgi:hypothetical protein